MTPAFKDDKRVYCRHGLPICNLDTPNQHFTSLCVGCQEEVTDTSKSIIDNLPNINDSRDIIQPNLEINPTKKTVLESELPIITRTQNGELIPIIPFITISIRNSLTSADKSDKVTHYVDLEKEERNYVICRGSYEECEYTISRLSHYLVEDGLDFQIGDGELDLDEVLTWQMKEKQ